MWAEKPAVEPGMFYSISDFQAWLHVRLAWEI